MRKILTIVLVIGVVGAILASRYDTIPEVTKFKQLVDQPAPKENSEKREFARQIAKRMKDRYASLSFLSMDAEITEIPPYKKATVKSTMRPYFYETLASFDGQLVWELTFKDGKSYEHRLPFQGKFAKRVNYKVQEPTGPGNIELSKDLYLMGCMIGSFLETWIGSETYKINLWTDRIHDGWHVGDETVDEFLCHVFFYRFPKRPIAETYYVDVKTFLVRRRDVFKWEEKGIWLQTQTHHNIVVK